ncbi:putative protein sll1178 [Xanthomonas translucens pv. poae]|uniref:Carbamoyltransferase n=1 Tax=Xanthomonas graminis pv. poae TaxID=227946 RepID=A0A0K3A9K5_9XANT|nr:carbamoyltransferase [Xanthomonas translucens]UKE63133.1 carbamoyltransferase [Xanthomonas translucens pv. poae]CTP93224.1 putative protein sll1178 [Xanthomonas translucens pv. poae]
MTTYILGISCFYHDSAAAILADGDIVAAAQEERFSRIKHDSSFPNRAVEFCLRQAGITLHDVKKICYYEDPGKKFNRILGTFMNFGLKAAPAFVADVPSWLTKKLHVRSTISEALRGHGVDNALLKSRIELIPHHLSHAASAFYPSPFEEAAILCVDGVGEWATTSAWRGKGGEISPLWEIRFPHSLGLLYSAFTWFCGFKVDSGEYKLMGLAPYGKPIYRDLILKHLIDVKTDGSFWLNMEYFDYAIGDAMTTEKFSDLFGGPRRPPEAQLTQREFDLAASVQDVLEWVMMLLALSLRKETGLKNLCLAGGVALNCVSNGKLAKSGVFDAIWAQPASGDSGGALGAAYASWFANPANERHAKASDHMRGSYLGTAFTEGEVKAQLDELSASYRYLEDEELAPTVARLLMEGNVIGWFQGRMEYGPRSLGARSILGDARSPEMQSTMNLKIKNRESFRPFAPAVLASKASKWFDMEAASPYMLFVYPVAQQHRVATHPDDEAKNGIEKLKVQRSRIPAVTHVDHSARVQTVCGEWNPRFHDLIEEFDRETGCPVIVNTSFNVRGEPIVESPTDAYTCFMRTAMDYLMIGNHLLAKTDQPAWHEKVDWREHFALD